MFFHLTFCKFIKGDNYKYINWNVWLEVHKKKKRV